MPLTITTSSPIPESAIGADEILSIVLPAGARGGSFAWKLDGIWFPGARGKTFGNLPSHARTDGDVRGALSAGRGGSCGGELGSFPLRCSTFRKSDARQKCFVAVENPLLDSVRSDTALIVP